MEKRDELSECNLIPFQKEIEKATTKVAHTTKCDRDRDRALQQMPETWRIREEAAPRCTKKKKRCLQKEARKARADHLIKCCLVPVRRKTQRKPLSELYVNGKFTEDREEWQKELQRHCEGVYTDQEETREVQKKRIDFF